MTGVRSRDDRGVKGDREWSGEWGTARDRGQEKEGEKGKRNSVA